MTSATARLTWRRVPEYEPPLAGGPRVVPMPVPPVVGVPALQLSLDLELPGCWRDVAVPVPSQEQRRMVRRLFGVVLEVVGGRRSPRQLERVFSAPAYRSVTSLAGRRGRAAPRRLHSVRLCRPAVGVIEASATVDCGGRARAMVARLEAKGEQWRCTALHLL